MVLHPDESRPDPHGVPPGWASAVPWASSLAAFDPARAPVGLTDSGISAPLPGVGALSAPLMPPGSGALGGMLSTNSHTQLPALLAPHSSSSPSSVSSPDHPSSGALRHCCVLVSRPANHLSPGVRYVPCVAVWLCHRVCG